MMLQLVSSFFNFYLSSPASATTASHSSTTIPWRGRSTIIILRAVRTSVPCLCIPLHAVGSRRGKIPGIIPIVPLVHHALVIPPVNIAVAVGIHIVWLV
jgi:hypothetical protein